MTTGHPQPLDPKNLLQQALHDDERAQPWTAPAIDQVAARFPELLIEERIGQGGMAAVYRAVQKKLDRRVALKVLRPDLAKEPEFVARFLREAKALAQLSHPHVLAVHDFGERDGLCYLLVEFVDGANLRELMAMGRLSPAEALRIVPQICSGLQFAHEHGVVHRDVKPENVLVDRQGRVVLADFGLAKLAGGDSQPQLTRASMVFGTPHYMAPEQWHGSGAVDHRADIYSLGVVLYELLTGRLPVGTYEPASKSAGVPGGIDQVVHRSLEQEPERRYQSAREVQRDVEREAKSAVAVSAQSPSAPAPVMRGMAARGWRSLAAAVLVVLTTGAGFGLFVGLLQSSRSAAHADDNQVQRNVALMHAIRAAVSEGKAWTGALPERIEPIARAMPDPTAWIPLLIGAGSGAVALIVVLLLAAARRGRACGDRGLVLAVGLVAVAPFVVAADISLSILAGAGRRNNELATVAVIALILASNGLMVRWLWQCTRGLAIRALPNGRRLAIVGGLAAVAMVGCGGAAVWICKTAAPAPQVVLQRPIAARELAGKTRTEVLDLLGPPVEMTGSIGSLTWVYRGLDGTLVPDALLMQADTVVATSQSVYLLVPEVRPDHGAYLGMSAGDLFRAIGAPWKQSHGTAVDFLSYADGTEISLGQGVVCGISHRQ